MTLAGWPDHVRAATARGVRRFNLAFLTAGAGCEPVWGGVTPLSDPRIVEGVRRLRESGGDVRASFGGAQQDELAQRCTGVPALTDAYRTVIEAYQLVSIDFDVEGRALDDADSVRRRNQAVARLQRDAAQRGTQLRVSYTLPVDSEGLTDAARFLLHDARDAGVTVDAVNVMAMNFGSGQGSMAERAMTVAGSAERFVAGLMPALTEQEAWKRIALTSMIGINDVGPPAFEPGDARRLVAFAQERELAWLSFWSLNRDRPCPPSTRTDRAVPSCSSIPQRPNEFLTIFAAYVPPTSRRS